MVSLDFLASLCVKAYNPLRWPNFRSPACVAISYRTRRLGYRALSFGYPAFFRDVYVHPSILFLLTCCS